MLKARPLFWSLALLALSFSSLGCMTKDEVNMHRLSGTTFSEFTPEQLAGLETLKLGVVRVWGPDNLYTATCIADGILLTAGHCVDEVEGPTPVLTARMLTPNPDEGLNAVRTIELESRGDYHRDRALDWAVLSTDTSGLTPVRLDSTTPLQLGNEVVIVGYPQELQGRVRYSIEVIRGRVSRERNGKVTVILPPSYREDLSGISGGAIARWDEDNQEFVLVAICALQHTPNVRNPAELPFLDGVRPRQGHLD